MRRAIVIAFLCGIATGAQSPSGDTDRFEVASIRPAVPDPGPPRIEFLPGGGFRASNVTLNLLIQAAYEIRPEQLSGGPAWADSVTFTVQAKGPPSPSTQAGTIDYPATLRRLQSLLTDRFQLVLNRTAKARSGYALVVAKGGHKMRESTLTQSLRQKSMVEVQAQGVGMGVFAQFLAVRVRDAVVDKTGLTARYDFTFRWEFVPGSAPGTVPVPNIDSIFPSLSEQLGLKLEREKVNGESLVIVRAGKPAEE